MDHPLAEHAEDVQAPPDLTILGRIKRTTGNSNFFNQAALIRELKAKQSIERYASDDFVRTDDFPALDNREADHMAQRSTANGTHYAEVTPTTEQSTTTTIESENDEIQTNIPQPYQSWHMLDYPRRTEGEIISADDNERDQQKRQRDELWKKQLERLKQEQQHFASARSAKLEVSTASGTSPSRHFTPPPLPPLPPAALMSTIASSPTSKSNKIPTTPPPTLEAGSSPSPASNADIAVPENANFPHASPKTPGSDSPTHSLRRRHSFDTPTGYTPRNRDSVPVPLRISDEDMKSFRKSPEKHREVLSENARRRKEIREYITRERRRSSILEEHKRHMEQRKHIERHPGAATVSKRLTAHYLALREQNLQQIRHRQQLEMERKQALAELKGIVSAAMRGDVDGTSKLSERVTFKSAVQRLKQQDEERWAFVRNRDARIKELMSSKVTDLLQGKVRSSKEEEDLLELAKLKEIEQSTAHYEDEENHLPKSPPLSTKTSNQL